jgi:TRAP-type C4-dicarboxylate transport system permease small subunit
VYRALDSLVAWVLAFILAVLVAIGGAQVVYRFVLNNPLSWVGEVSVILLVWATMLSGYLGVRRQIHLSADFVGIQMSVATRWKLDLACLFLSLLFVVVYGVSSMKVVDAMDGIPFSSIPIAQPVMYWSLPISAALMALAFFERIRQHWLARPGRVA